MSKDELRKLVRKITKHKHSFSLEDGEDLHEMQSMATQALKEVEDKINKKPDNIFYKLIRLQLVLSGYPLVNFNSSDILKFASDLYSTNENERYFMYLKLIAYQRQNEQGFFGKKGTKLARKFSFDIPVDHNKNLFMIYVLGRDRSKKKMKRGAMVYREAKSMQTCLNDLEAEKKDYIAKIISLAFNSYEKFEESIDLAKSESLFNSATLAAYANLEKYNEALDMVVKHKLAKKGHQHGELLLFGRTIPNDPFVDLAEGVHPKQEEAMKELFDQFKQKDQYLFIKPLKPDDLFSRSELKKYEIYEMLAK